jgi:hypothetical protein
MKIFSYTSHQKEHPERQVWLFAILNPKKSLNTLNRIQKRSLICPRTSRAESRDGPVRAPTKNEINSKVELWKALGTRVLIRGNTVRTLPERGIMKKLGLMLEFTFGFHTTGRLSAQKKDAVCPVRVMILIHSRALMLHTNQYQMKNTMY